MKTTGGHRSGKRTSRQTKQFSEEAGASFKRYDTGHAGP